MVTYLIEWWPWTWLFFLVQLISDSIKLIIHISLVDSILWLNSKLYMLRSIHTAVMYAINQLFCWLHWGVMSAYIKKVGMPVMHVLIYLITREIWGDICSYTVRSRNCLVMCAAGLSLIWMTSRNICRCTVISIDILVTCVVKDSEFQVLWECTSVYIAGSTRIFVMCVISPLLNRVLWKLINAFIADCVPIRVIFVIKHLFSPRIWKDTNAYILKNVHIPAVFAASPLFSPVIWRNINAYILVCVHILVKSAINHSPLVVP